MSSPGLRAYGLGAKSRAMESAINSGPIHRKCQVSLATHGSGRSRDWSGISRKPKPTAAIHRPAQNEMSWSTGILIQAQGPRCSRCRS